MYRLAGLALFAMAALLTPLAARGNGTCIPGPEVLCLLDGRFAAEISWDDGRGRRGAGRPIPLEDRAGSFWFFDPTNPEMLLKVLDGRGLNGSFWVFYGSLTTVAAEIRIRDHFSGREWVARNHVGEQISGRDFDAFPESATAPAAPEILEPAVDGALVNPFDVHMESGPFADPDPGAAHYCSDFEIWQTAGPGADELVWQAICVLGPAARHAHFVDGSFRGSRAFRDSVAAGQEHLLRVRYRDQTGVASAWSERAFTTTAGWQIQPLALGGVAFDPAPRWTEEGGQDLVLPGGSPPPALLLESPAGEALARWEGLDGGSNLLRLEPPLAHHVALQARLVAGSQTLVLGMSRVTIHDDSGPRHEIYLPALSLGPGESATFWIADDGSTFTAPPAPTAPDFSHVARLDPIPWRIDHPGLTLDLVADELRLPVSLALVPDPGPGPRAPVLYLNELYGNILVLLRDGSLETFAEDLLNFDPSGQETGLAGLLILPDGDLMVTTTWALEPGVSTSPITGRVLRIESLDGGRRGGEISVLFDTFPEQLSISHQISNLSLGPDQMLYVHVGDGFRPQTASDLRSALGKILRMDLDGSAPVDNPFYDPSDGIDARDFVFAFGFRNPFGGAWRQADGALYEVELGPSVDRLARVEAGAGYGWDADRDGQGGDDDMRVRAIYNWQPAHAPVQIAFLEGAPTAGGLPADLFGHAFVSEFGPTFAPGRHDVGKRIVEVVLDAAGQRVEEPRPLVSYTGWGRSTVIGLAAGPDALYFTDFFDETSSLEGADRRGSRLWRLRAASTP